MSITEDHKEERPHAGLAGQPAVALERTPSDEAALLRERLLALIGHDLRSPLQAISMSAQLLVLKEGDAETRKLARRIVSNSERMNGMIGQLVDFARSRLGGGLPLDLQEVDLAVIAGECLDELGARFPHATLERRLAGPAPGLWDGPRLGQVISTLVANGIQHGDVTRPVRVLVSAEGDTAAIQVHNHGPVIPEEQVASFFSPLRLDGHGRPQRAAGPGLGLGLFIAREIVQAHGGTIAVTSAEGHGTMVSVRLPRRRAVSG